MLSELSGLDDRSLRPDASGLATYIRMPAIVALR